MHIFVVECVCGNSRSLFREILYAHPSATIRCGGLRQDGTTCDVEFPAGLLIDKAQATDVYRLKDDHVQLKQMEITLPKEA